MSTEVSRFKVLSLTEEDSKDMPLDVELISDSIDAAGAMDLGTSTRKDIDLAIARVLGHLRELLSEELGADTDGDVMELFKRAYRLLELSTRPAAATPTFGAYTYLQDAAGLSRSLLEVYSEIHEMGVT